MPAQQIVVRGSIHFSALRNTRADALIRNTRIREEYSFDAAGLWYCIHLDCRRWGEVPGLRYASENVLRARPAMGKVMSVPTSECTLIC